MMWISVLGFYLTWVWMIWIYPYYVRGDLSFHDRILLSLVFLFLSGTYFVSYLLVGLIYKFFLKKPDPNLVLRSWALSVFAVAAVGFAVYGGFQIFYFFRLAL